MVKWNPDGQSFYSLQDSKKQAIPTWMCIFVCGRNTKATYRNDPREKCFWVIWWLLSHTWSFNKYLSTIYYKLDSRLGGQNIMPPMGGKNDHCSFERPNKKGEAL